MQDTMKYLCENIQGCILGYTESDEITLILIDYQTLDTSAWFDYEVQKMCSVSASMATLAFNKFFSMHIAKNYDVEALHMFGPQNEEDEYLITLLKAATRGAMFDSRVFNIPKEEVTNLIYWRQLDAARNSVQMVGQANFSHKELQGKSCNDIQDMLMTEKGINWNDFPTCQKRGSCCVRKEVIVDMKNKVSDEVLLQVTTRPKWVVDTEIPIFKGEDRKYIDDLIYLGD